MKPYNEEALRQEVIYLHSLWHQGPPNRNPNPSTYQNPNPYSTPRVRSDLYLSRNLHVTNNNPFHRPGRQNEGDYYGFHCQHRLQLPTTGQAASDSGAGWPLNLSIAPPPKPECPAVVNSSGQVNVLKREPPTCFRGNLRETQKSLLDFDGNKHVGHPQIGASDIEATKEKAADCGKGLGLLEVNGVDWSRLQPVEECPLTSTGWPSLKRHKSSVTHMLSSEELAKIEVAQLQQKILEACQDFFAKTAGVNSDEDDGSEEEDEDYLIDEDESEEYEEYKFFLGLFTENGELRNYYEKHYEGGDFCCLVCGGIRKKVWRRFKDCAGLLQHSIAIVKTKKKRAHWAFVQVICKVLGWDISRLPTIVIKDDPPGRSSVKLGLEQEHLNEDDANRHVSNSDEAVLDLVANREGKLDSLAPQSDGTVN